ncbi:MAG: GH39 family glycosyl hydrolase, partial [Phycisphaerae bacterium]
MKACVPAGWLEHLSLAREHAGFRYCRFHGLFHDDMYVYQRSRDGSEQWNFQLIDDLFDRMLDIGVRPFVELGFVPKDLASNDGTCFRWGGHTSTPTTAGPRKHGRKWTSRNRRPAGRSNCWNPPPGAPAERR